MAVQVSAMELAILIRASSQGFSAFKEAQGGVKGVTSALKAMQAELVALAAAKTFAFVGSQISLATSALEDFSREMATIQVVSGANAETLKEVEEIVRGLGKTTMFTATESANAFKMLLKAGLSVEQAKNAIEGVLAAATVSGENFGQIADDFTDIMKQFGLGADRMDDIADVLLTGSNRATTSMGQLAEGLSVVGAGADQLGETLPQTVADLALLAEVGIKGSEGGTKLRQILLSLIGPTGEASDLIKDLGLEIFDASGNFVGMTEVLKQFHEKGILETGKGLAMLSEIVGKRQAVALAALVKSQQEVINLSGDLTTVFENQAGEAKAGAEIINESFGGTMTAFRSLVDDVRIGFGQQLAPMFIQMTQIFRDNSDELRSLGRLFADLMKVIFVLLVPVGLLLKGLLNLAQFLDQNRIVLKALMGIVVLLTAKMMMQYVVFTLQAAKLMEVTVLNFLFGESSLFAAAATWTFTGAVTALTFALLKLMAITGVGLLIGLGGTFLASKMANRFGPSPDDFQADEVGRQSGTSMLGIQKSGLHFLHKGEVVSNPRLEGQRGRISNSDNRRSLSVVVNMQVQEFDMDRVVEEVNRARMRMELG